MAAATFIPGGRGALAGARGLSTGIHMAEGATGVGRGIGTIGKTIQRVRVAEDGVTEITLKFKKGWNPEQIQQAIDKITAINRELPKKVKVDPAERAMNARRNV